MTRDHKLIHLTIGIVPPSFVLIVYPCQDVYRKRQELECPECRKKVTDPIDSLPPNILANRILESMGQQRPPAPAAAPAAAQEGGAECEGQTAPARTIS